MNETFDERFNVIGRQLAKYFGAEKLPFVLLAVSSNGNLDRHHCCANVGFDEVKQILTYELNHLKEPAQ